MPTETPDHPRGSTTGAETAREKNITQRLKSRFFLFFFFFFPLISFDKSCPRSVTGNTNNTISCYSWEESLTIALQVWSWWDTPTASFSRRLLISQQTDRRSFLGVLSHLGARAAHHAAVMRNDGAATAKEPLSAAVANPSHHEWIEGV